MVDTEKIDLTPSTKYLGVIIDEKLNWNDHITERIKKCRRLYFACKKAIGKKWGLTKDKIIWIYKTIILPILTYGSVVWGNTLTQTQITKLEPLQNLVTNAVLGAIKSTPKYAQNILTNLLAIDSHIQMTSLHRAMSLKSEGHWEKHHTQSGNQK